MQQQENERKMKENYNLFCHYKYKEIIQKHPHLVTDGDAISVIIAKDWNMLSIENRINFKVPNLQQ